MGYKIKNFRSLTNITTKNRMVNNFLEEIKQWESLNEGERQKTDQPRNIYIVKPGEVTNRGRGIQVLSDIN